VQMSASQEPPPYCPKNLRTGTPPPDSGRLLRTVLKYSTILSDYYTKYKPVITLMESQTSLG